MINDILFCALILFVLVLALLVVKKYEARLGRELSRKFIHITMGCVMLPIPWMFKYKETVIILGCIAAIFLLIIRKSKLLKESIGSPLFGVERSSYGEIFFILSVIFIYYLHTEKVFYIVPILILTFADSVAALVGVNYGKTNLSESEESKKSTEGTVMFFMIAFICTLIPVQLLTEVGRLEVLIISFLIAMLAALVEAVSYKGNDNFALPILVYSFLTYNLPKPASELYVNFVIMIIILILAIFVYKKVKLSKLAVCYALLVSYIILIQGDIIWIIPPAMLFLTFGIIPFQREEEKALLLDYRVIECNSTIGIACLIFANIFREYYGLLFMAYSLSFASFLIFNTYTRFKNYTKYGETLRTFLTIVKSVIFIGLSSVFIRHYFFNGTNFLEVFSYFIMMLVSTFITQSLNNKYNFKVVSEDTMKILKIYFGIVVLIYIFVNILGGVFNGV